MDNVNHVQQVMQGHTRYPHPKGHGRPLVPAHDSNIDDGRDEDEVLGHAEEVVGWGEVQGKDDEEGIEYKRNPWVGGQNDMKRLSDGII